jgi:hypothetical protein
LDALSSGAIHVESDSSAMLLGYSLSRSAAQSAERLPLLDVPSVACGRAS